MDPGGLCSVQATASGALISLRKGVHHDPGRGYDDIDRLPDDLAEIIVQLGILVAKGVDVIFCIEVSRG